MTRIVLVDDDEAILTTLGRFFRNVDDVEVVGMATDGVQGVAMIEAEAPDVVLMDVQMPELDGISAARLLRERGNQVPVLFLTAQPTAVDAAAPVDGTRVLPKGSVSMRETLAAVRLAAGSA